MNETEFKRKNVLARVDWLTVFIYLALVIFGWVNIYSSVYKEEYSSILSVSQRYGKQMLWIIVAFVIIAFIFLLESRILSFFSYPFYGLTILLLIAVLFFGTEVKGSRSWFEIGDFKLQPAELAKLATALALARFMGREGFKLMRLQNFLISTAFIILPAVLIILQGDAGSALIYLAFVIVLYREGLPSIFPILIFLSIVLFIATLFFSTAGIVVVLSVLFLSFYGLYRRDIRQPLLFFALQLTVIIIGLAYIILSFSPLPLHIVITASVAVSATVMLIYAFKNRITTLIVAVFVMIGSVAYLYSVDFIYHKVLEPHQKTRINILFDLEEDNKGAGYNMHQSLIAIGSGGFSGKGFLNGTQTKGDFVPEQDTDFIYCTVGEEWGFIGSAAVVIIFTILILRIIMLAEKQYSPFSRVYGYAVASVIFFHYAVNIAMTIKLAPVIGIPLPFFSYGGSSLWAFTILLFIFIKLDTDRDIPI